MRSNAVGLALVMFCAIPIGCRTGMGAPLPPTQVTALDRLMAFIPAGFTSYAVMAGPYAASAVRVAFGGSDISHADEQNSSDWVGIKVEDFGPKGVPKERLAKLRQLESHRVSGVDVTYHHGYGFGTRHHWTAIIDERYLLDASHRDVLRRALERRGLSLALLALEFGFEKKLNLDHAVVLLRRWTGRPIVGGESTTTYMELDPDRMEFWIRTEHPKLVRGFMQQVLMQNEDPFEVIPSHDDILHLRFDVPQDVLDVPQGLTREFFLDIAIPSLIGWPPWI